MTSHSAGHYLCNFLYYHSLDWALRQAAPPLVLFVHIPPLSGKDGAFSEEQLLHGAQDILRFVLAFASEQDRANSVIGPALAQTEAVLSAKDA